jgi:serine/threonine protein kinase
LKQKFALSVGPPCTLILLQVLTEINLLHELHHENIVALYGYFHDERGFIIFMELMSRSIKEIIIDEPLSEVNCINYLKQTARGLSYLHNQRPDAIIHRDVKCKSAFALILIKKFFKIKRLGGGAVNIENIEKVKGLTYRAKNLHKYLKKWHKHL